MTILLLADDVINVGTLQTWFEISKSIGAGATFILAPMTYLLWKGMREEIGYSKTRDKETLTVLNNLTVVLDNQKRDDENHNGRMSDGIRQVLDSISELKQLVTSRIH